MQKLVAIVAAVSVGWHAVAGCCAHHAHAASAADPHTHGASHSHHAQADAPAFHLRSHGPLTSPAEHRHTHEVAHADDSGCMMCADDPFEGHPPCGLGSCDFAAPKSPNSLELDDASGLDTLSEALPGPRSLLTAAGAIRYAEPNAPSSTGALRVHLQIGVWLL